MPPRKKHAPQVTQLGSNVAWPDSPDEAQLERVLEMHRGNLTAAARSLGLARSTLRDRLRIARERAKLRRGEG